MPQHPGNINLYNRPAVPNPQGGLSTVFSMGINEDGQEVLIPRVVNGKVVSEQEAINHYRQTGEHLGKFPDVASANAYAEKLHNDYAAGRYELAMKPVPSHKPTSPYAVYQEALRKALR